MRIARKLGVLLLALVAVGSAGCVSSGKYKTVLTERDQLLESNSELNEYSAELEATIESLRATTDELKQQLASVEGKSTQLRGTYDALVSELESEVQSGKIQIDQLAHGIQLNVAQDILFPSGSSQLDASGQQVLTRVADRIESGDHIIEVEGHTDDVPISGGLRARYETNWELAASRATRVVRLFQDFGIGGERLRAVSKGPFAPLVANDSTEGRAKNRRIEIRLLPLTPEGELAPVPAAVR